MQIKSELDNVQINKENDHYEIEIPNDIKEEIKEKSIKIALSSNTDCYNPPSDNKERLRRNVNGLTAEYAVIYLLKYLKKIPVDSDLPSWNNINSKNGNIPDLEEYGYNVGIKSGSFNKGKNEYWMSPLVFPFGEYNGEDSDNSSYPQIICMINNNYSKKVNVYGIADDELLRKTENNICDQERHKQAHNRGKRDFTTNLFSELIPIEFIDQFKIKK